MNKDFNFGLVDNNILSMQNLYKKIDTSFKELKDILKEIKTKECWNGKSCDRFIEVFQNLEKNYDTFLDEFNSDIILLENVSNSYRELEEKMNANNSLGGLK